MPGEKFALGVRDLDLNPASSTCCICDFRCLSSLRLLPLRGIEGLNDTAGPGTQYVESWLLIQRAEGNCPESWSRAVAGWQ